jgi:hypothetical protein
MSFRNTLAAAGRAARSFLNKPRGIGKKSHAAARLLGAIGVGTRNRGSGQRPSETTVVVEQIASKRKQNKKQRAFPQSSQGVAARRNRNKTKTNKKHYIVHVPYCEECLGNVVSAFSAGAFDLQSYVLNIGNFNSFPQGSVMAPLFQRHRFRKLIYRIETSSGSAVGSSSTALGTTLLNCDYNTVDAVFVDQIHMEDYGKNGANKMCKEAVIFKNNTFHVDCSRAMTLEPDDWMFVQPGTNGATVTPISNTSVHEYSHGLMQIASVGLQGSSQVIGRLFVGYESDFAVCVAPVSGATSVAAHIQEGPSASATNTNPLGTTAGIVVAGSTLATVTTTSTFTLPILGNFLVSGGWSGTGITAVPTYTGGANITTLSYMGDDATYFRSCFNSGGTSTDAIYLCSVTAVGTGAANVITISGLNTLAAGKCDIFITQLPSTILTSRPPKLIKDDHRLLDLEKKFAALMDSKFDDDDDCPLVCPSCNVIKLQLPFNGYCSRKCMDRAFPTSKDNLIHIDDETSFVRVSDNSSIFPGIPLADRDDYILRLSSVWTNVLPIPSTMPNCVDLVCRGRRGELSTLHATKV